jgi:N-acetylneuraminic acid mutarotase
MNKRKIIFICLIGLIYSNLSAQKISWTNKANLPKPMRGTAITCNNKIYFMEAHPKISGVYEYSPIKDTWDKKTDMITQGWNVNLAEVNGIIYAIGGDPFRNRNESYDPINNIWNTLSPMPTARQHSNCCVVDNKIYVLGGITSWADKTDKNEVYDPKTDSWQSLSPLPNPIENPIIASVDNNIYALCGNILWMYDTSSDMWETKENCPAWISVMFGCAVISDKIIIPGGQNEEEKAVSSVYIYDTKKDKWSKSTDLPKPIQIGGITTLNGNLYMIGGCNNDFSKYDNVYEGTLVE